MTGESEINNQTGEPSGSKTNEKIDLTIESSSNEKQVKTMPVNEVCRVSIKPPAFLKNDPALYFLQMEAQFSIAAIVNDGTKFNHIIASLDPNYLQAVSDIVRTPPTEEKYETLKTRIINEFTLSDQRKLRQAIHEIELGDDKPSLKRMKDLSGNSFTDEAIKSIWIERLPPHVRAVIAIAEGNSTNWAKLADKMMENTTFTNGAQTYAVSLKSNEINKDEKNKSEIAEIKSALNELVTEMRGRNNERKSQNNNRRFRSHSRKEKKEFPFCYYHFKFGNKARKCTEPCTFEKTKKEN